MKDRQKLMIHALAWGLMCLPLHPCLADGEEKGPALKGAEVGKWTMDYDAALKLAASKDLPILLNFTGSDWCHWCILMEKEVFSKPAWQEYAADKLVLVTIDFPRTEGKVPREYAVRNEKLQAQYKVQGFPTYMIVDSDGKTLLGMLGADREITPSVFIEGMKEIIRFSSGQLAARIQALGEEKGEALKAAVAKMKDVEKTFQAWLDTDPLRSAETEAKLREFVSQYQEARGKVAEML